MNAITDFPTLDLSTAIETLPLASLSLSTLNPRQEVDDEGIALLASSLVACGLIQNLVGLRDADGSVAIVAGGRRLRALTIAVAERPDLAQVPVLIAPDHATALAWASAENVARQQMDAADEIRSFRRLGEDGHPVPQIARVFGVTEAHVYRRLRLAALPGAVLDALKARQISLDQAAAFTLAADPQAVEEILPTVIRGQWGARSIQHHFKQASVKADGRKARFVGVEAYEAAGGGVTRDLFSTDVFLDDDALLNRLFDEKLEAARVAKIAEGWCWAEVTQDTYMSYGMYEPYACVDGAPIELTPEQGARLDALLDAFDEDLTDADRDERRTLETLSETLIYTAEQRAVSGVILRVDRDGTLVVSDAYVRPSEAEQALAAGVLQANTAADLLGNAAGTAAGAPEKPKSAFSEAMRTDLKAARLHAFQSALRKNEKMALALFAFSLSGAAGGPSLFGMRSEPPQNVPNVESGMTIDPLLLPPATNYGDKVELSAAYAAFAEMPKPQIMEQLVAGIVRTLHTNFGSWHRSAPDLFEALGTALKVNPRAHWTPTKDGFWSRMPAHYLDKTFRELTGFDDNSAEWKAFSKLKKGEKADNMDSLFNDPDYQKLLNLSRDQIKAIAAWMPDENV